MEKAYSYSKDDLSLLPLRVHSEETLRGYLFIIFLSLIVYMEVQKEIGSVEMSLDILRNLKCKVFEKEIVIQELTKDHNRPCASAYISSIPCPSSLDPVQDV